MLYTAPFVEAAARVQKEFPGTLKSRPQSTSANVRPQPNAPIIPDVCRQAWLQHSPLGVFHNIFWGLQRPHCMNTMTSRSNSTSLQ